MLLLLLLHVRSDLPLCMQKATIKVKNTGQQHLEISLHYITSLTHILLAQCHNINVILESLVRFLSRRRRNDDRNILGLPQAPRKNINPLDASVIEY